MTVLSWIILAGESVLALLVACLAAGWAQRHWACTTRDGERRR